jgi:hypothetical protein
MNEQEPRPFECRFLVWTDHTAERYSGKEPVATASWFWSASGPRGHMGGAEGNSDAACRRAYAAFSLLSSAREQKS